MLWNADSKLTSARLGYNRIIDRRNEFPDDEEETRGRSYHPDKEIGSTGQLGRYIYQLDENPSYYTNPRTYCLNWYVTEQLLLPWQYYYYYPNPRPCPCSWQQAEVDPRFRTCNFAYYDPGITDSPPDLLPNFNPPGMSFVMTC